VAQPAGFLLVRLLLCLSLQHTEEFQEQIQQHTEEFQEHIKQQAKFMCFGCTLLLEVRVSRPAAAEGRFQNDNAFSKAICLSLWWLTLFGLLSLLLRLCWVPLGALSLQEVNKDGLQHCIRGFMHVLVLRERLKHTSMRQRCMHLFHFMQTRYMVQL
jgi:hypothetical protein